MKIMRCRIEWSLKGVKVEHDTSSEIFAILFLDIRDKRNMLLMEGLSKER